MTLPFGIDISKYQASGDMKQLPDWAKMRANTDFVALRAGISWGYEDPLFSTGWNALQAHCRMAYHVLYPSQDGVRQADWFWDIVSRAGFDTAHDRLVVDVELDQGCTKAQITTALLAYMARILYLSGRNPVIYSRASWINAHVDVSGLPALTEWWLAHYLTAQPSPAYTPEKPSPPALPKGVSNWLIHQTGERGNGGAVGVRSHYVDTNRWNGTLEDLRAYFGLGEVVPPEPEPPVEKLFDARVYSWATPYVNIRKEPSINSEDLGDLYPNTVVGVTSITGEWYGISNGFVMSRYLERLDYQPPAVLEYAYFGPVYNQRDIRWSAHPLGTRSTIGANGCLMTCASMVCNYFGHATNPLQLNQWLTDNEGYLDGNLFLWAAIERLYPDMKFDGFVYSPTTAQIRAAILAGTLPIMFVDFDDSTPLIEMHWVLGIGVTGTDVIIADPWTGTMGKLSEMYPKAVIRYGSYSRK